MTYSSHCSYAFHAKHEFLTMQAVMEMNSIVRRCRIGKIKLKAK